MHAQAVLVFYIFGKTGQVATDISGYSGNTNSKITVGDRYATKHTAVPPTVQCLHLHMAGEVVVTNHTNYSEIIYTRGGYFVSVNACIQIFNFTLTRNMLVVLFKML